MERKYWVLWAKKWEGGGGVGSLEGWVSVNGNGGGKLSFLILLIFDMYSYVPFFISFYFLPFCIFILFDFLILFCILII